MSYGDVVASRCEGRRAECHGPHLGATFTTEELSKPWSRLWEAKRTWLQLPIPEYIVCNRINSDHLIKVFRISFNVGISHRHMHTYITLCMYILALSINRPLWSPIKDMWSWKDRVLAEVLPEAKSETKGFMQCCLGKWYWRAGSRNR